MITIAPVTLEGYGARLEPLAPEHATALKLGVRDGYWPAVRANLAGRLARHAGGAPGSAAPPPAS